MLWRRKAGVLLRP